jgi:hypothetical protein
VTDDDGLTDTMMMLIVVIGDEQEVVGSQHTYGWIRSTG